MTVYDEADVGDVRRYGNHLASGAAAFTNAAGTADDPDSVELIVEKPDLTQTVYVLSPTGQQGTLVKESTGRFYADVEHDQAGWWAVRLAGTGSPTAAAETLVRVRRSLISG